jgi:hypothetical protein
MPRYCQATHLSRYRVTQAIERKGCMGSSSKKRQTFAKMTRERMVKEKRALKQEKKEAKKLAAAIDAEIGAGTYTPDIAEDEQAPR